MEIWKNIEGYENYQVSNLGRVKSLNYKRLGREQILKPYLNNNGYYYVNLSRKSKTKMSYIHRLVAQTFIPNTLGTTEVNHISTDRTDNRVENLEWCTHKENMNNPLTKDNMKKNSSSKGKFGKSSNRSKAVVQFTVDNIFLKKWDCAKDAQRQINVNNSAISMCCHNKKKHSTAGGYKWKYLSDIQLLGDLPIVGRLTA